MRKFSKWWLLLLIIPLGLGSAFVFWAESTPPPMPEALGALEDDSAVRVESEPWLAFNPQGQRMNIALILYPGGRVEAGAYAPLVREIAVNGYPAFIVPMPLNLAFFDWNAADRVMAANPQISAWVIGGHSLGGAMAARYAHRQRDRVDGLLLLAAYPAESDDLSTADIAVTSVYGTRDGLATPETIAASQALLPDDTQYVAIQGGNHAQFGWYGPQDGDNPATISRAEQVSQTASAALALLERVEQAQR